MTVLRHRSKMLTAKPGHQVRGPHRADKYVLQFEPGGAETRIVRFHSLKTATVRINNAVIDTKSDELRMAVKPLPQCRQRIAQTGIEQDARAAETAGGQHGMRAVVLHALALAPAIQRDALRPVDEAIN